MNFLEIQLSALIKLLTVTKTRYVIIGGLALSLYGEPRTTFDIDVNISIDKRNLDNFLNQAKRYGFYPIPSSIKSFAEKTGVIPMSFSKGTIEGKCDIIIAENPIELAAIRRGRVRKLWSLKAKFVTAEDLVIHKITSDRPRDREDLKGILIRQKNKLDLSYIRDWLKKIEEVNPEINLLSLFSSLIKKGFSNVKSIELRD